MGFIGSPAWDRIAAMWVSWMVAMSWQVALLAVLVWIVTRVFRRTSAAFRFALWGLVLLKLAIPPDIATPWSLGNLAHYVPTVSIDFTTSDPGSASVPASTKPNVTPGNASISASKKPNDTLRSASVPASTNANDIPGSASVPASENPNDTAGSASVPTSTPTRWPFHIILMFGWAAVASGMFLMLLYRAAVYHRRITRDLAPLDPARDVVVQEQAARLRIGEGFTVRVSPHIATPMVCLLRRPAVLLPTKLLEEISDDQFAHLIAHELAHIKRHDLYTGWAAALLLCLYWFHPAVWVAAGNLRREREMACDDEVLYTSQPESKAYATTMLKVAESFDGAAPAGSGFLGLFEAGEHLLQRIRSISDATRPRRAGAKSMLGLLAAAIMLLPMGVWTAESVAAPDAELRNPATSGGPPASAATSPDAIAAAAEREIAEHFATVDAETHEYILWTARTFGRNGLWQPEGAFDHLSEDARELKIVHMVDALNGEYGRHLCQVLADAGAIRDPRLVPGLTKHASFHREDSNYDCRPKWMAVSALGRQDDIAAVTALIPLVDHGNQNTRMWARASLARLTGQWFGDDKQAWGKWWNKSAHEAKIDLAQLTPWTPLEQRTAEPAAATVGTAPEIVAVTPAIGATGVDPATTEIRVTFDQDMNQGGFSWTGGGEVYPEIAARPFWADARTCVLPVKLVPAKFYRVGINSKSHKNFRSAAGVPARNRAVYFATEGLSEDELAKLAPPTVISLAPPNGATGVPPATASLTVTFDKPMGGGFSWVTLDDRFPETTAGASWSDDHTVCTMPVSLKPNTPYRLGLNSGRHINFQSAAGLPLEPLVWEFATGN